MERPLLSGFIPKRNGLAHFFAWGVSEQTWKQIAQFWGELNGSLRLPRRSRPFTQCNFLKNRHAPTRDTMADGSLSLGSEIIASQEKRRRRFALLQLDRHATWTFAILLINQHFSDPPL